MIALNECSFKATRGMPQAVGIPLERTRFELQLDGRLDGDALQILLNLNLMFFYH